MRYYIMYPESSQDDLIREDHQLGEDNGFGVFWAGTGLKALMNIVQNHEDYLIGKKVNIITDKGQEMTVEEFLKAIEKLKVRIPD